MYGQIVGLNDFITLKQELFFKALLTNLFRELLIILRWLRFNRGVGIFKLWIFIQSIKKNVINMLKKFHISNGTLDVPKT